MLWMSLAYDDYTQLKGMTEMTVRITPETILYGDGDSNTSSMLIQPELIP